MFNPFKFVHIRSIKDIPHLIVVLLLISGIALGVYLALQPQIFNKQAAEDSKVEISFFPESVEAEIGKTYEVKIAVNPKGKRVTAASIQLRYDPQSVAILSVENGGFLPIELKNSDDFTGNLIMVYGTTIETQANQPGILSTIKFKTIRAIESQIEVSVDSQINTEAESESALSVFPKLDIVPVSLKTGPDGEVSYPNNLLQEPVFIPSSDPAIREFKDILNPDPEPKPGRVKPGFSEAYIKQLGSDVFIEPIKALNDVLQEKAKEVLKSQ